jgi:hypothetical protein
MARQRKAESAQEGEAVGQPQADSSSQDTLASSEVEHGRKSTWLARFPVWTDAEAGVHLIEDRQNRRMAIKFDEKPGETVRGILKEQHGYRFDGENQLWYKRMNPATPRQDREEAEQLAFSAANLIREEKGLEQKKSFSLAL